MEPDLTVSRQIAASPDAVFAAISDVTRMGEWSPECVSCEWLDGHDSPVVGARFAGTNRNGDKEWTTTSTIVEAVPGERFFFDCDFNEFVFAKWGYTIEESEGGSLVTELWQDLRPEEMRGKPSATSGVTDRVSHNEAGMVTTLERLAAAVEG